MLAEFGRRLAEFVDKNNAALQSSFEAIVSGAINRATEQAEWHRRLMDWVGQITKAVDALSATLDQPLRQAGVWLPPSADLHLYELLEEHVRAGSYTPASIRELIVSFFHANECDKLSDLVGTWEESRYLQDRWPIVTDALEAHKQGKYTLSVPSLLPMVEGMLISQLGKPVTGGVKSLATNVIRGKYREGSIDLIAEAMLAYLVSDKLYGNVPDQHFFPDKYSKWLEDQGLEPGQVLNRHAILHGIHGQYATVDNSLRVFFILDYLAFIDIVSALT